MWEKRIGHSGLNAFRVVRGQTQDDVDMKVSAQQTIWAERWLRKSNADRIRTSRANLLSQRAMTLAQIGTARATALEQTRELALEREGLEKTLLNALARDPRPDWSNKKDRSPFPVAQPQKPTAISTPREPLTSDSAFAIEVEKPTITLLDKLIRSRRRRKLLIESDQLKRAQEITDERFKRTKDEWIKSVTELNIQNLKAEEEYEHRLADWQSAKIAYLGKQQAQHNQVEEQKRVYHEGVPSAVEAYAEDVLSQSNYPDSFPREHTLAYLASTRALVIDYELPNQTALPLLKEVKYVASRSEFQEVPVSEAWLKKTYDELLYQISLRTLHELFVSDEANVLVSVVFNGWVRSIDRATGSEIHSCVMSLETRKDEFLAINLSHVDCKACFRKLKGVAASKLIELSPIKPLVMLNRQDSRFIDGYAVVEGLDEKTNLAAMDWLDFENLIREVFEKEFSKGGGEVKITQASRDGGVDAIVFDPDPIRGGKLVIQAKRYTNTVGVSAVRDLYGTVHNEGANKGILVTTSDFGPDAYAFARDKPTDIN